MKTNKTISLDVDTAELAKAKGVNLSEICNTYLKQYLLVDQKTIPREKELLIERRAELQAEANIIETKLREFQEKERKEMEEKLKKQKIREEKIRKGEIEFVDLD